MANGSRAVVTLPMLDAKTDGACGGRGNVMYQNIVETSPDIVICYDLARRRTYVNATYEALAGLPREAFLGKTLREFSLLPLDVAASLDRVIARVAGHGIREEITVAWQDGGIRRYHHVLLMPVTDEDNKVIGVSTFSRDISALKEAENRLEQLEALARVGHWQWDFDTHQASVSPEVCRIFGKPPHWIPTPREVLKHVVKVDRTWLTTALNVAYATQAPDATLDYRIQVGDRLVDLHASLRILYADTGTPTTLVGIVQDVSELKGYQQQLQSLTFYDALTGLPNRQSFSERLRLAIGRAQRRDQEVHLLLLDMDHFKTINETLGHDAGDRVLRETAARLLHRVRDNDTVARLGGDEFGLILADFPTGTDVRTFCRQIIDCLGQAYRIDGQEVFLGASIGVARFPADGLSASDLLQNADAAVFHAKKAGRNNYQFYASSLTARVTEHLALAAQLRHAGENGEFELYYQPQIDLGSGRLVGAEALIRWRHPKEGLLTPDRFIAIAEDTGLIVGMGEWVLRTACTAARAWNRRRQQPIRVAVNMSPRQFVRNDLVGTVKEILAETDCQPDWIEIEITESLLLDDTVNAERTLQALREMGLAIAIDDFGTGYSALGYLNRYPISTIKIDRSFTRGITVRQDTAELVKAILAMAHSLNLTVVAEGIEEGAQQEFLTMHGCQRGQGFLYSKPLPKAAFESLPLVAERDAPEAVLAKTIAVAGQDSSSLSHRMPS